MARQKNSKYWQERFVQLEEQQNKTARALYPDIERAYRDAQQEIIKQIEIWFQRFADNNQITVAEARKWLTAGEMEELRWDVWQYIEYGRENALDGAWLKELENASARFHINRLEAIQLQNQHQIEVLFGKQEQGLAKVLDHVYKDGYYHSIFEVQKGFNLGWDVGLLDQAKVDRLLSKPWTTDGKNFSTRIWESKQQVIDTAHKELSRMSMQGKTPTEAIKTISHKLGVSKNQAGRLVMTESAYFGELSHGDAFRVLDVEEFLIVATLDSKTSEICQDMDGVHAPMTTFEAGVTAPPFHPWCRSTTAPYFDDEFSIGSRAARGANGKTYYVPSNMTYHEWAKTQGIEPAA